jgi:hypothetical protein
MSRRGDFKKMRKGEVKRMMRRMRLGDLFATLSGRKRGAAGEETARFAQPQAAASAAPNLHPWHAVSVAPGLMSCPSARKLRGIRFLSRRAPSIPLPACTNPKECTCRFQKHNDRRHGDRRLFGVERDDRFFSGVERRRSSGRRSTDPRSHQ